MNPVLVVIPVTPLTSAQTEMLLDWIFELDNKEQKGCCLVLVDSGVHAEMREKIKISGEIAFSHFEMQEMSSVGKTPLEEASSLVSERYRGPWFWMEPDCTPVKAGWREHLATEYTSQPKRYMGVRQQRKDGTTTVFRIHPTAIYPSDHRPGVLGIVARTTHTKSIQIRNFNSGMSIGDVDRNALVVKGDKEGALLRLLSDELSSEMSTAVDTGLVDLQPVTSVEHSVEHSGNGNGRITASSLFPDFPPQSEPEGVRVKGAKKASRKRAKAKVTNG